MSMQPTITTALAEQHRCDLTARATAHRIARGAHPAPVRPSRIVRYLMAAARRPVTRLLPPKAAATASAARSVHRREYSSQ
jgi:hypothetical protein